MCRRTDIEAQIYTKVEIQDLGYETPCHIWTGSHSGNGRGGGYPRMCLSGHTVAVHRVMYTNRYGFIPGKKQIDHKCRNRMCVNPEHLEMVTHKQNQRRRDDARTNPNYVDVSNPVGLCIVGPNFTSSESCADTQTRTKNLGTTKPTNQTHHPPELHHFRRYDQSRSSASNQ